LTRSNRDLASAAPDPKFPSAHGTWPVYVSRTEDLQRVEKQSRQEMKPEDFRRIQLRVLPEEVTKLTEGGLLYLPRPYVVPGGRFNEMCGWDSYFIQVGPGFSGVPVAGLTGIFEAWDHCGKIRCGTAHYAIKQGSAFGYRSNEVGFGWTNAAFTNLYDALPPGKKQKLLWSSEAPPAAGITTPPTGAHNR
jgi:hypothetical protein